MLNISIMTKQCQMFYAKHTNNPRILQPRRPHKPIPHTDHDTEREYAGGDAAREEMLDLQVSLARLGVFHHYCRCWCALARSSQRKQYCKNVIEFLVNPMIEEQ